MKKITILIKKKACTWITHHHEDSGSNHNISSRRHWACVSQKRVEIFRFDSAPYSHAENHDSTYPEHKVEGEKQVLQALHPTTEVGHLESNTNTLVCWKFPHSISSVSKNIQCTDTNVPPAPLVNARINTPTFLASHSKHKLISTNL